MFRNFSSPSFLELIRRSMKSSADVFSAYTHACAYCNSLRSLYRGVET
jgi:hypothetical protein